ncbi:MAG: hypothetical protein E7316_02270 [Clostridiales bacterium]|nr:hypothetical protein [Clostridiales bacterium]
MAMVARKPLADADASVLTNPTETTTEETQATTGSGSGNGSSSSTSRYTKDISTAKSKLNAAKPTYTDTYASRIKKMETDGPGTYTSKYGQNIDSLLNKLNNRQAFQYNMSQDPLYQQLAAKYMSSGKQAMQDTMGQAAALTGGYGSSYASTAGSQAYQQHLNQLNDDAIELYSLAKSAYDTEGDNMRSNLSAYQTAESALRSNFESDRADYYNRLNSLRDGQSTEYQQYRDDVSDYDTEQERYWTQYKYWNDLWEDDN